MLHWKQEAESIVGSIKQLGYQTGRKTCTTKIILKFTKKNVYFKWTDTHKEEQMKVKKILRNLKHITLFEVGDKTIIFFEATS